MREAKRQKTRFAIGQSTAEYAVLLALVATAIISMQIYMKRGIQGRIRDLADQISPAQYEKGRTNSFYSTNQAGATSSTYRGQITSSATNETLTRSGNDNTMPEEQ